MNILLIYPEFPDTFWSFKHALEFVGKRAVLPPLGLLTVASMLPREWSQRLVDTNVRSLTKKDLAWADCAFISAMAVQRESADRVIARCKEAGLRIVAGGPLFQIEHEKFEAVDHFILNEAELTLPAFLQDLAQGNPERIYFIRRARGFAAHAPAHVGAARPQAIRQHEYPVLSRLPLQLRFLQCHGSARPSRADQNLATDYRRA